MFFEFGIKDVIDIFLVALMLYYIYRLMKESRSLNVFYGIIVFVLIWLFVSQVLEMKLLGSILSQLASVGVIGLIVLFKEEIRKFLYQLALSCRQGGFQSLLPIGLAPTSTRSKSSTSFCRTGFFSIIRWRILSASTKWLAVHMSLHSCIW